MDNVSASVRTRMMSSIKSKNTQPEIILRQALHKAGFRFRIHVNKLPGRPDIVLAKYNVVILVNGCFWHRHQNCQLSTTPKTRIDFWNRKFESNILRDKENIAKLLTNNWRVIEVWECGIKANKDMEEIFKIVRNKAIHQASWPH